MPPLPPYDSLSGMDRLRLMAFAVEHLLTDKRPEPKLTALREAALCDLVT